MLEFAIIGVGGYVAPRHLAAIKAVEGNLLAAVDPNDSVGIMDSYFPDAHFFTEFDHFDTYLDEHIRAESKVDYISICSPNHLHRSHVSYALRRGADAICEKPLVLNLRDLDELAAVEQMTGQKAYTILQLRLYPAIMKLREKYANSNTRHTVDLTYIASRGRWYHTSWKGDVEKSGGVATNIGIHLFDMLSFLFGSFERQVAHVRDENRAAGYLRFRNADVRWFLSIDHNDLPECVKGKKSTFRAIEIDGEDVEFSDGFTELHNRSYGEIVAGRGFSLADVRSSIETVSLFRSMALTPNKGETHPLARRFL